MRLEKHHYFYLFVGFLFLGVVSVNLFSDGMFMDGLFYAAIARNMAHGLGSFWQPHLSQTLFSEFYEHPPLALGLQSLAFRVFGDSIYVERLYSLFTYLSMGSLMVLIWGKLTNDRRSGWIALFLLLTVGGLPWAVANNVLENTMGVFTCLSVWLLLGNLENGRRLRVVLAGLSLSMGLLAKGFFCLYIWDVPFFLWLFKRQSGFRRMASDTAILVGSTLLPIAFLYGFLPAAQNNMNHYFNEQVVHSILNVQTVGTRFAIIGKFLHNILPPLVLGGIAVAAALRQGRDKKVLQANRRIALMFLAIVLSGVLPIMISLKQSGFYILTVYPLFALGLACYLHPVLGPWIDGLRPEARGFGIFKKVTAGVAVAAVSLALLQIGRVGRDKETVADCRAVIDHVGEGAVVNICPDMYDEWGLHGYFSRYGKVSLDPDPKNARRYFLAVDGCCPSHLAQKYSPVDVATTKYRLYRRKPV